MECSICYEEFIQVGMCKQNDDEAKTEFMENHQDDEDNEIKFMSLMLLPHHKPRYKCPNDKCCKYICDYCYDNTIDEKTLFKCHYCRMVDYKTYIITNVLRELQIKVLGKEGFIKLWREQFLNSQHYKTFGV